MAGTQRAGLALLRAGSTLECQSQIHKQSHRFRVPQTVTYGIFDCEFDFGSQEWSCSYRNQGQVRVYRFLYTNIYTSTNMRISNSAFTDSYCADRPGPGGARRAVCVSHSPVSNTRHTHTHTHAPNASNIYVYVSMYVCRFTLR